MPSDDIQYKLQQQALEKEGFGSRHEELVKYREFVRNMSVEDRKEIFFLRVNDQMFKPDIHMCGLSVVTDLYDLNFKKVRITDFILEEGQIGYFIIASSLTCPQFVAKIHLLDRIIKINRLHKFIFIYTAEAHADDVWPVGYGINQT